MTYQPLTKAERANVLSASSADGYYAHDISRLCADLDAAEAERDALRLALERIAAPTYGTEIHDTDKEMADTYGRHLDRLQKIAREALL